MAEPRAFGRYEVVERLGRGGMGVVYRAFDPLLHREVAIKVLSPDLLIDAKARARFNREGRALAALQHPNVTTVHEFGEQDGAPFLVIEFLRGHDLAHRIQEGPALTLDEKLDLVLQVCAGLTAAHDAGIAHLDVKPANISLLADGRVKLLDFGIARTAATTAPQPGSFTGSPAYMAPEQLSDDGAVDHRADLFALGVVAYELLGGRRPFLGDNPTAVMLRILNDEPPDLNGLAPGLPPPLVAIVGRALQKNPAQRYQTAKELAADVVALRAGLLQPTLAATGEVAPFYAEPELQIADAGAARAVAPARRWLTLAAAAVAILTVGTITISMTRSSEPAGGGTVAAAATVPAPLPAPETRKPDPPADSAAPRELALRVESEPTGAKIIVDGRATGLITPADLRLPVQETTRVALERAGFRTHVASVSRQQLQRGVLRATLESTQRTSVSLDADYPFEVWSDSSRLSAAAVSHRLAAAPLSFIILRAPQYFVEHRVQLKGTEFSHTLPKLGRLDLRVANAMSSCPMTITRLAAGRGAVAKQFDEAPGGPLLLAAGQYRIDVVCANGLRGSRTTGILSGQLQGVRITQGS
jgi:eukaryotic-like serine/threonine-protein kinase